MLILDDHRKATSFCLLILINFIGFSQTIDSSEFFLYNDGIALPKEDDTHSEQIVLSPEMPFITTKYESVYVSVTVNLTHSVAYQLVIIQFFLPIRSILTDFCRFSYPSRTFFHKLR